MMTENEKSARVVIDMAITFNISVPDAVHLSLGGEGPALTDKECQAIAANYPYSWQEVRRWFEWAPAADQFTAFSEAVARFKWCVIAEVRSARRRLKGWWGRGT